MDAAIRDAHQDRLMPEPIDFDRIARLLRSAVAMVGDAPVPGTADVSLAIATIRQELMKVWDARGAADTHAVEERLSTLTGWVTSEPYRNQLREAIEALGVQAPIAK